MQETDFMTKTNQKYYAQDGHEQKLSEMIEFRQKRFASNVLISDIDNLEKELEQIKILRQDLYEKARKTQNKLALLKITSIN